MLNFQITACLSDQTSSATRRALIRRWVQEKMVCPEAHSAVKATITAVSFAIFIGITYGFSMDLFSMLIPDIYNSIGLTYVEIGAIAGAARFGFFAASLFAGALASRIGPGRVILGSVILSILAQVGMSVAHASWLVLVLALILGVCSSAVYMPMVAVVGKVIAFRHRARAFGVISSGQSYAVFFCGFFVPPVLAAAGWREVWQLVSTIGLLVTALAATLLVYYKIVERKCRTQTSSSNQTPHPPFRAICTPPALMVWLLMLLSGLATYPFQTYLSPYVREELRMPVEVAGNMWAAIGFVGMWGGFLMGFVADWVGIRAALVLCYLAMLLAASMLYLQAAPFYLVGAAGLYGLAYYAMYGLFPAYISKFLKGDSAVATFGFGNVLLGASTAFSGVVGGVIRAEAGTFKPLYLSIALISLCLILSTFFLQTNEKASGRRATDAVT